MGKYNAVHISGNVTADSQQDGKGPVKLSVAWNKPRKDGDEWVYDGHFFDVIYWPNKNEPIPSFTKGQRVVVEGHIEQQRWETDEGAKRSKVVIVADSIGVRESAEKRDDTGTERDSGDEPQPQSEDW